MLVMFTIPKVTIEKLFEFWLGKFMKIHQFLDSFEEITSNVINDLDKSDLTLGKAP